MARKEEGEGANPSQLPGEGDFRELTCSSIRVAITRRVDGTRDESRFPPSPPPPKGGSRISKCHFRDITRYAALPALIVSSKNEELRGER